jgi:hypothetical protein
MLDARIDEANRISTERFWWALAPELTPVFPDALEQDGYSPDPYSPDPYSAI